ncbi:MAG: hypothetical protein IKU32_06005 [Clostridia bacterium]|nr:hypothetical protein [Clostridia bacterium]
MGKEEKRSKRERKAKGKEMLPFRFFCVENARAINDRLQRESIIIYGYPPRRRCALGFAWFYDGAVSCGKRLLIDYLYPTHRPFNAAFPYGKAGRPLAGMG